MYIYIHMCIYIHIFVYSYTYTISFFYSSVFAGLLPCTLVSNIDVSMFMICFCMIILNVSFLFRVLGFGSVV